MTRSGATRAPVGPRRAPKALILTVIVALAAEFKHSDQTNARVGTPYGGRDGLHATFYVR